VSDPATHAATAREALALIDEAFLSLQQSAEPFDLQPFRNGVNLALSSLKALEYAARDSQRRLDFALGVIEDHDYRLMLDYRTRVEEEEAEARGQAMEP